MPLSNKVTSATITLHKINEVSIYNAELISTNGNIFHPYDINTDLIFKIFNNTKDITSEFKDIIWTRVSYDKNAILEDKQWGKKYEGLTTISISKNDFQEKCLIQADAYTVINGKRTCVASARITLLDVNELYSGEIPPENPVDGQIWVDTGGSTPMIYSWNDSTKQWVSVGKTDPVVRNLIKNSNFWTLNSDYFNIENDFYLLNPIVKQTFNKNWVRLKSNTPTENENTTTGISQITDYPIVKDSFYTFSFLAYCVNDIEYTSILSHVKIISIDKTGSSTELLSDIAIMSNVNYERKDFTFKTLKNTEHIKVVVSIAPQLMCEFYITELSLYNTDKIYPWEMAPEDIQYQLENKLNNDHESVFNALTKNGTMEGIYVDIDENGEEHFFFNGTHIKAGSIDGGLIDGIGLNIKDDETGQSIFHVYKDENGTHIDMIAKNLYIGTEPASTQQYANIQAALAESNAVGYTNTTVAANRAESEALLNGNIESFASNVKTEMTSYVDEQIAAVSSSNSSYVDTNLGQSALALTKLINDKTADAEKNSKKYTDEELKKHSEAADKTFETTNKSIAKAKDDAIKDSKSYTDSVGGEITKSIEAHSTSMNNYLSQQFLAINNNINAKADNSVVSVLSEKVTTLETNTKIKKIVEDVLASKDYKDNIAAKLDKSVFDEFNKATTNTIKNINESITNINKTIESNYQDLSGKIISENEIIETINESREEEKINLEKIDISNLFGDIESPVSEIYSEKILCNNGDLLFVPGGSNEVISLDKFLDSIDIFTTNTDIRLNVTKLKDTKYINVQNSKAFLNIYEIIKFLLYKVKDLESKIE